MVDQNHNEYQGVGIYVLQYTMKYCTILVLYVRKRFGLEYNNNLICFVYIIYTIVICDSTYIMKIMKGFNNSSYFMYEDDYNCRVKCCHYKIKEMDGGLGIMGNSRGLRWLFLIVIWFVFTLCDLYAVVVKDRGYVVDKINVKSWGLLLTLIKI